MPIIYEDALVQIVETVTATGKTVQTIHKPGSPSANRELIVAKADAALTANGKPGVSGYLNSAAIPAGAALTTTQLTTVVRALRAQVDSLTKQNNALIRLLREKLDDTTDS